MPAAKTGPQKKPSSEAKLQFMLLILSSISRQSYKYALYTTIRRIFMLVTFFLTFHSYKFIIKI